MTIELTSTLIAGAIAAILIITARIGMKKVGIPLQMDVLSMLGNKIGGGRRAGMAMHTILGAIFALPYVWGFVYFGISTNLWLWGILGGLAHWIVAGALLGMMPGISVYAKNFGKPDVMGFLMGHLLFGLFVGASYTYLVPLL